MYNLITKLVLKGNKKRNYFVYLKAMKCMKSIACVYLLVSTQVCVYLLGLDDQGSS